MDPRSRNGIIQFEIGIINIIHKLQETFVTAKSKITDYQKKLIQLGDIAEESGRTRDA